MIISQFINITRYRYIDSKKLERLLNINIDKICLENNKKRKENKNLKRTSQPLQPIALKLCSDNDFRNIVLGRTSPNSSSGIPQGTPISDVIANMYMLEFDIKMKEYAAEMHGYYRRYSDDILFICPSTSQDDVIDFISNLIVSVDLKISTKKTLVTQFDENESGIHYKTFKGENLSPIGKPFEYLGLSYDGYNKKIRQSTISRLYIKLSARIKDEAKIAILKLESKGIKNPTSSEIYKMINFDKIRNSYMKNMDSEPAQKFIGNFYTYTQLVSKVTENEHATDLFNAVGPWIKKRAKKCCDKLEKKKKNA